jgi:hypothetical protein
MTRLYGRAPRGRRLLAKAPFGHWKTTTFVAALRRGGLDAPMVLDGPMTGQAFLAYVEQVLIPTLHPDDIVVMDNCPRTKSPPFVPRSPPPVPSSSCCRPIRPT